MTGKAADAPRGNLAQLTKLLNLGIQQCYESDGEQIAIPLEQMSDAQRQAKIDELRAMGSGCYQHARELERYRDEPPAPPNHEVAA